MSRLPSVPKPYSVYRSQPFYLVEKTGTKGGSRDKPKAYNGHVVRETKLFAGGYTQSMCYNDWDVDIDAKGPWNRMESRAHAKIQALLGDRAEIGTTLAEYHSAMQMVGMGVVRLSAAVLALKQGNFKLFLESLNAKPLPKHRHWARSSPKIASKLWIEYWFGWSPTINDIQQAAKILDSEPPTGSIPFSVATGQKWRMNKRSTYSSSTGYGVDCQSYVKSGGKYRLVNPNLALAQQLGILNPLTITLNVTPWSWLLGWFVNLNQWVDSLTAFAGYTFTDCYTTQFTVFHGYKRWDWDPAYFTYEVAGYRVKRYLRLPKVRLHLKQFNLSLTRAATAVSLLTLRLKSL